ncbi:MAG: protease complex subunit PrcB family protein [Pseudomonadota bacterium]
MTTSKTRLRHALWFCFAGVAAIVLGGCQDQKPVVTEVLNYQQCRNLADGITQISLQQLAAVRGTRLLQTPGAESEQVVQTPPHVRLFSIYQGPQPNSGYKLQLESAEMLETTVRLNYRLQKPAPDTITAQVVTQPCSVVQIDFAPEAADRTSADSVAPDYGTVSAWVDGVNIGTVTATAPR